MRSRRHPVLVGLAISTLGRRPLGPLLSSAAASSSPPAVVAIANQSGAPLHVDAASYPFNVRVVTSSGGLSRGRNAAVAALGDDVDVLAFPNDDSTLSEQALGLVASCWAQHPEVAAVAGTLLDPEGPRFVLPPAGTVLTRRSVWRAIEPATFISLAAHNQVGGFRVDLGTGAPSPWQSGEGTDLLLRLMARGHVLLSRPDITVLGPGERRALSGADLVAKHRAYARGTGHVYRAHNYPVADRARILMAPLIKAGSHDPSLTLSLRLALARSVGRLEGLLDRRPAD